MILFTIITTLLVIGLTIYFGRPAIKSWKAQIKTKIFYFEEQNISLFSNLVNRIPDLSINYQGKSITANMFILKGIFICSGNKDIMKTDIQKGIIMRLSGSNSKWHGINILKTASNLEIRTKILPLEIIIDFELLRNEDYIMFEAWGECPTQIIKLEHRIANVPDILKENVGVEKKNANNLLGWICNVTLMLALTIFSLYMTFKLSPLKHTFYDSVGQVVADSMVVDTMESFKKTGWHTKYQDSLEYQKDLKAFGISNNATKRYEIEIKIDSEYTRFSLWIDGETKKYKLDKNYQIGFRVNLQYVSFIPFLIFLSITLFFAYVLSSVVKDNNRFRKIGLLASKLTTNGN